MVPNFPSIESDHIESRIHLSFHNRSQIMIRRLPQTPLLAKANRLLRPHQSAGTPFFHLDKNANLAIHRNDIDFG
jgi:hypothetical protein